MPYILQDLPYFEEDTEVHVGDADVPIKAFQIVLWISLTKPILTLEDFLSSKPPYKPFPVLLDTGLSHNFLIREELLKPWLDKSPADFESFGRAGFNRVAVPMYHADIWLYYNRPGSRDELLPAPPFQLEVEDGIGIYETGKSSFDSLPTLGLRAIDFARCQLTVNAYDRFVSLSVPDLF